ncbi:hypothetical protein [Hyalangium minutum]|uniref:hypothetical protein n=1 Tax=Hyalangium minutum TaxID=394096 RepID=UPI0005C75A59|nr:hypothetical protein [Hyalangium minutum]
MSHADAAGRSSTLTASLHVSGPEVSVALGHFDGDVSHQLLNGPADKQGELVQHAGELRARLLAHSSHVFTGEGRARVSDKLGSAVSLAGCLTNTVMISLLEDKAAMTAEEQARYADDLNIAELARANVARKSLSMDRRSLSASDFENDLDLSRGYGPVHLQ